MLLAQTFVVEEKKNKNMAVPLLVAFDFDHTIVEDNTDVVMVRLVKDERAIAETKEILKTQVWTIYMQRIFELLHESGASPKVIEDAISGIPAVGGFPALLKSLHARGVEIVVISDSNAIFINHWLKHQGLEDTIREVFTNPAWFDETGLLNINMYHIQDWCELSEKNMCKGHILETYVDKRSKEGITFGRIAYVGDGRNDLCPLLRLSIADLAFPRRNYPLSKILQEKPKDATRVPKAQILPWTDGTDIWHELVKRIPDLDHGNDDTP